MKAFADCRGTKRVFGNRVQLQEYPSDGKVWDDGNQWGTACTSGAHARCILEGIPVLQPSHVLAQRLFSLSKILCASPGKPCCQLLFNFL